MLEGRITGIYIAREAGMPMEPAPEVRAVPGAGLEGDRYLRKTGTYSNKKGSGREVTLIEAEAIEALERESGVRFTPGATRRNLITRGVPLNHLVGRRFTVGEVVLEGKRLCEPCDHLAGMTDSRVLPGLVHRGGLRCAIIIEGVIRVNDSIREILPDEENTGSEATTR